MNVPLQPEKEAWLVQIAAQKEDDICFVEAVNLGLAAAQRGEFVEHEEVGETLKQICEAERR